ncbi:hypothetical protein [Cellulomonas alba]|uniref:Aromatic ring-opening dioxygenase LigA n=1 Tax=Cellulomonas alba TaxID=3053467 RepID=A0ABT7SCD5_9CELL|nr:hypothetical protein [Cellulomonas alba]MDM7853852.1 hypothetical protein [Cellulomonas alba]
MSTALVGKSPADNTLAPAGAEPAKVKNGSSALRVLTVVVAVVGAVFLVVGGTMFGVTSAQLKNQQVTVAPYDEGANGVENGAFAGKTVAGPFTALAQIHAIQHHMGQAGAKATGGKADPQTGVVTGGDANLTFGTTPMIVLNQDGTCKMPVDWTDPAGMGTFKCEANAQPAVTGSVNAQAMSTVRSTLQTGSLLVGSLYVSVLAFGVSALVAGLGVVLLIVAAWQYLALRTRS